MSRFGVFAKIAMLGLLGIAVSACSPKLEPAPEPSSEAAQPEPPPASVPGDREQAAAFLEALASGNEGLKPYGWRDDAVAQDRMHMDRLRAIAAANGLVGVEYARGGPILMVVFYRPEDEAHLYDQAWLKANYMKTMFACNFEDSHGAWRFTDPLYCYSESEGPFDESPDV